MADRPRQLATRSMAESLPLLHTDRRRRVEEWMLGRHDLVDAEVVAGRESPAGAVRTDNVGGGPARTPQDATTRPVLAVELLAVRSPWIGDISSRHESNFHLGWTHLHDGTLIVEAHASGDR